MSRRDELLTLGRCDLEALVDYVLALEARLQQLEGRVQELEGRLAQNSRNSGRPPSSDGLAKPPRSLREKSGRKPGGQPGHPGRTLSPVAQPDRVVVHPLECCPCGQCGGRGLAGQPVEAYETRQVFDLPPLRLTVTEHRVEIKRCRISGRRVRADFPAGVDGPVQYGPNFQGLTVYLSQQQLLPYDRLAQLCEDLFGQPLSAATAWQTNRRVYEQLAEFETAVVLQLVEAAAVHVDESGLRVEARLHWLHVASTAGLTFYGVHARRGTEAMDALGVLPQCRQWLVHDHWKPYFTYDALHALCNQHLLRELKFLAEEDQQPWATQLSQFLLAQRQRAAQGELNENQFKRALGQYHELVQVGRRQHPRLAAGEGRCRQSQAANLLDRLEDYDLSVLAFLIDPRVPFTNNQAEQDIRMIKVQQKISGGFRTLQGARVFARIRGYLSTCRKQGRNLWEAMQQAVRGTPFLPSAPAAGP